MCCLALHRDQPVSREKLAGLLVTDTASEFACTNLHQCISVVRKALHPGILASRGLASAKMAEQLDDRSPQLYVAVSVVHLNDR